MRRINRVFKLPWVLLPLLVLSVAGIAVLVYQKEEVTWQEHRMAQFLFNVPSNPEEHVRSPSLCGEQHTWFRYSTARIDICYGPFPERRRRFHDKDLKHVATRDVPSSSLAAMVFEGRNQGESNRNRWLYWVRKSPGSHEHLFSITVQSDRLTDGKALAWEVFKSVRLDQDWK